MKKNSLIKRVAKIIYNNKLSLLKSKITPKKYINYSAGLKLKEQNSLLLGEKVEKILDKYKSDPIKLVEYIKGANTPIYIVENPNRILAKIKEEQGFIMPQRGFAALYLNLILNRKISFQTSEMFVMAQDFSSYLFTYEFYKWYCYKTNIKGYEQETQIKFKKVFNFNEMQPEEMSFDDIIDVKTAIARDIEAIEFVKKYSMKHSGASNAFKKLVQKKSASI